MTLLCIVAAQRSGTTALQSALGASGQFENMKEIFHTGEQVSRGRFVDFARRHDLRLTDFAAHGDALRLTEAYVDFLIMEAGDKVPLIDIKFNSWLILQPFWAYPHQEPILMQVLKRRGAAFVFVRRRDLAGQVLSEQIARAYGIWHGVSEDEATRVIDVDIDVVREQARLIVQAENFFGGLLSSHPRCRSVLYEEMYDDDRVNPDLAQFCFTATGRTQDYPLVTPIPKNAGRKSDQIANHARAVEVIESVARRFGRNPG